jgi:Domain of unknown function (DUF5671)
MLNFYLYSISAIALTTFYFAALVVVNGVLQIIFNGSLKPSDQRQVMAVIAGGLGYLLIALPLWWMHWRWLRQEFEHAQETSIPWHRFYLFTIVCLNAIAILILGSLGIAAVARLGLGVADSSGRDLSQAGVLLFAMALSAALWAHHWGQFKGGRGRLLPEKTGTVEA